MAFEWDPQKANANFIKHGVRFTESQTVFDDDLAITIEDDDSDTEEQRFITIGMGIKGRVLVAVFCYRDLNVRIISVRLATPKERQSYEENR